MSANTVISGDLCSEHLLPTSNTEILIQKGSGSIHGDVP